MGDSVTFGVEEEFLLVDAESFRLAPASARVVDALPAEVLPYVKTETRATQIELATSVLTELEALAPHLYHLRSKLDDAARSSGCRIMPAGACILKEDRVFPVADEARYGEIVSKFGLLEDPRGLCACHVHVGVPDRHVAAVVLNHLRVWMPVLQALCSNSPFLNGEDTGYASSRAMTICAWPTVGPSPEIRSLRHHDDLVAELIATGAALDDRMVYWYARISAVYPTVELRLGDVCLTVEEAVLVAALSRALVATAIREERAGVTATAAEHCSLVAAHWLSARDGLEGSGFCFRNRVQVPIWQLIEDLVKHVEEALVRHGDYHTVIAMLDRLRTTGSGAARQRAVAATGDLQGVARWIVEQTCA
jgi:carboxylate-amine ligase